MSKIFCPTSKFNAEMFACKPPSFYSGAGYWKRMPYGQLSGAERFRDLATYKFINANELDGLRFKPVYRWVNP